MKLNFVALKSLPRYQSFGNNFNLGKELRDAINKKLKGNNSDCFVPSSSSQPIIVENLEINTKENKGSGGILSGAGAGVVSSGVVDAVKDSKKTEQHKNIDTDKLIDETAENNNDAKDDMAIDEICEQNDLDLEDSTDDSDINFDDIDD